MEIPKGFIVHHKDGNKTNNCILNLQLMSLSEHMRLHHTGENHYNYGGTIPLEQRIKIGNSRRGKGHTEETKKHLREVFINKIKEQKGEFKCFYSKNAITKVIRAVLQDFLRISQNSRSSLHSLSSML